METGPHSGAHPYPGRNNRGGADLRLLGRVELRLLGRFELRADLSPIALAPTAQRLLAYLALLRNSPVSRRTAAWSLWPERTEGGAGACLRSALWRLTQTALPLVDAHDHTLSISSHVQVDAVAAERKARALTTDAPLAADPALLTRDLLVDDVLPHWDEEWLRPQHEQFRQLRLHALEALCDRLSAAGRHCDAIEVGIEAVVADPLRESAHRAVMRAHIAEGNRCEAVRQYQAYRLLARQELGIEPSPAMEDVLRLARAGA